MFLFSNSYKCFSPLIAVAGALQMKFVAGAAGESQKTLGKGNQLASEAISGIRTISSFNAYFIRTIFLKLLF